MTKLEALALAILSIIVIYGVFWGKATYYDAPAVAQESDNGSVDKKNAISTLDKSTVLYGLHGQKVTVSTVVFHVPRKLIP